MGVTFKQLHEVLKKILAAVEADRGPVVVVGPKSGQPNLLRPLQEILAAVDGLEGNTDGIEALLSTLNGLVATESTLGSILTALGPLALEATQLLIDGKLGSLDTKATTRDGILQDIDDNTDGIEGRQDTGNTSLASILTQAIAILADTALLVPDVDDMRTRIADIEADVAAIETDTDFLATTFELLPPGAMATLIFAIEATIILITAQLEAGGLNVADLLTTIDADTSSIRDRLLQELRKSDRRDGSQVWEYSGSFTCNIVGNITLTWLCTAGTWSEIQVSTGGFPITTSSYQLIVTDTASGVISHSVGLITFQSLVINTTKEQAPSAMVGPLNNLVLTPQFLAPIFAVGNIINVSLRVAVHDDSGGGLTLPAIPTVGGTGTFAVATNVNRVTTL